VGGREAKKNEMRGKVGRIRREENNVIYHAVFIPENLIKPIYLSIYPSIYLSTYLSVYLSIYPRRSHLEPVKRFVSLQFLNPTYSR
jgi:hypothetical protein